MKYDMRPPIVRFWARAKVTDGCWEWTGERTRYGYGSLYVSKHHVAAHRFAYELLVGPIPEGLTIDHLCRNRGCVNPAHMEAVTDRENILRGMSGPAQNARKTHCPKGHPYTHVYGISRRCRPCINEQGRAKYAANPERFRERSRANRLHARYGRDRFEE